MPCKRAWSNLLEDFDGLEVSIFAAAEWGENPSALAETKAAIDKSDIIIVNLLFLEDHIKPILPLLKARREKCDAMIGVVCDADLVKLTRMGSLDMQAPESGAVALLKKLRGSSKPSSETGEKKMRMLRRLPKILKYIPGKAQDLRAWFLVMQYWLGGTDENIEEMLRFLISRYSHIDSWRGVKAEPPREYPNVGVYHPNLKGRISEDLTDIPEVKKPIATIGLLLMRSYVLSGDTAHYDKVIEDFEALNVKIIPAFAGGLDGRPAIEKYFIGADGPLIDVLVSLTGFSLVGGPAYNDTNAAVETLSNLNVPYISAHPLEFQTLPQWEVSSTGLGPIETTMLVALPELDGATVPTVYAGRRGDADTTKAMLPYNERVNALISRAVKIAELRRLEVSRRKIAIILFGFPPNAGAVGTAAYLEVFQSLFNTLTAMKDAGYEIELPKSCAELRAEVLGGNAKVYGQEANVEGQVSADWIVKNTPWLSELEEQWGPAPGRIQSDGKSVFILGKTFGNVFVGVQPTFGYEGDPMRLLFEKGFSPTHAFSAFYQWLKLNFNANAVLHFGMHGALEFMPGKQTGLSGKDWPDRLIGNLPNIYLYACNNPSEASLAKRRSNATIISHLTPPLTSGGLYKGLLELKDSLVRWREMDGENPLRGELELLINEQAEAVDLKDQNIDELWVKLLETEDALIPEGLHVVGKPLSDDQVENYLNASGCTSSDSKERLVENLRLNSEIPAILNALDANYIAPVPGGDLVRSAEIVPTGRNIHAFDPFRMPTTFACKQGFEQAQMLLDKYDGIPKSLALVLWGSDNIKSDGTQIAQALALIGAKPRFDSFGRLCGADLIELSDLGRPRIDVVMTLSGIFRDLLPLQTRMLAEAAFKAASANEDPSVNYIRANALEYVKNTGVDLETAALRVFSNAEGAYGSNVNQLVDSSSFDDEDELADAYEGEKRFCLWDVGQATKKSKITSISAI